MTHPERTGESEDKRRIPVEGGPAAKTPEELKAEHDEYFKGDAEAHEKIEALRKLTESKELESKEVIAAINAVEVQLAESQEMTEGEMLEDVRRKELETKLSIHYEEYNRIMDEWLKAKRLEVEIQTQKKNRSEMDEAKAHIGESYQGQNEQWMAYEREQVARSVANVAQEHGVIFAHGIRTAGEPGANSLLKSGLPWETKLKILLSDLEPTISASTFSEGDSERNLWAPVGVFLKGGKIESARHTDANTQMEGAGKRIAAEDDKGVDGIGPAIEERGKNDYNEFSVSRPEVAGVYFFIDQDGKTGSEKRPLVKESDKEIVQAANKLNLPVYAILNGKPWRATFDEASGEFFLNPGHVDAGAVADNGSALDENTRNQITREVVDASVFRMDKKNIREIELVDARNAGKGTYVEINAQKSSNLEGEGRYHNGVETRRILQQLEKIGRLDEQGLPDGSSEVELDSFEGIGQSIKYVLHIERMKDDELPEGVSDEARANATRVNVSKVITEHGSGKIKRSKINESYGTEAEMKAKGVEYRNTKLSITLGIVFDVDGAPNRDVEEHLKGIGEAISQVNEKLEKAGMTEHDNLVKQREMIGCYLQGFAEQAEKFGDADVAEQARRLADSVYAKESYDALLQKRIGQDGKLVVFKEDLE